MFRVAASLFMLSVAVHAVAAEKKRPVLEMSAVGEVHIAPAASVSDYRLQNKMAPEVATLVDRGVRAWHFEPVLVDGQPVVAKTVMRVNLKAVPVDSDNYRIEVVNVIFGEPRLTQH